jgi:hypothetical protein
MRATDCFSEKSVLCPKKCDRPREDFRLNCVLPVEDSRAPIRPPGRVRSMEILLRSSRLDLISDSGSSRARTAKEQFHRRRFQRFFRCKFWCALIVLTCFEPLHSQFQNASVDVAPGEKLVLQAKGEGDQIYACIISGVRPRWVLQKPDARLIDSSGNVIGNHFAGPTWKLNDGSTVQGELVASQASKEANSVPWLLLRAKPGTGTGRLAGVAFIRRTDTHGGVAPRSGCEAMQDIGKTVNVPYSAIYSYYAGAPD